MAQQPRLERQLKSPIGKTLNEERAPFSRSQKGRKGTFPPTSCSPAPAASALVGDTRHGQMLGSRPAPRGERQYGLCVLPASERCSGVCRAAVPPPAPAQGLSRLPDAACNALPGAGTVSAWLPRVSESWQQGEAVLLALSRWSETPLGSAGRWPRPRRLPLQAPGLLAQPSPATQTSPARHRPPWGNDDGVSGHPLWAQDGTRGAGSRRLPWGGCSRECPVPRSLAFSHSSGYEEPNPNQGGPSARKAWVPCKDKSQRRGAVTSALWEGCRGWTRRGITPPAKGIPFWMQTVTHPAEMLQGEAGCSCGMAMRSPLCLPHRDGSEPQPAARSPQISGFPLQRNPTSSLPLQINLTETPYWFSTGAGWIQPHSNQGLGLHVGHLPFSRTTVLGQFKLV